MADKEPWELAVEARRVDYARFETKLDGYEHWESADNERGHDRVYVHQLLAIAEGANPHELFGDPKQIHHDNGIPWDNRPSNITVKTAAQHAADHQSEQWGDAPWRDKDALRDGLESYSVAALAERWGCSERTIRDWKSRFDFPALSPGRKTDKTEKPEL